MAPPATRSVLRVLAAAARLAALYSLAVLLLLVMLFAGTGFWPGNPAELVGLGGKAFAALFAAVFLLLAVARRIGFALLSLLLIALWLRPVVQHGWTPVGWLAVFVLWSVLALPFYVLTAVGFPGRVLFRLARWTATIPALVLAGWILLIVFTIAVTPAPYLAGAAVTGSLREPSPLVLALAPFVWGATPVLISLEPLTRLWARGRQANHDAG